MADRRMSRGEVPGRAVWAVLAVLALGAGRAEAQGPSPGNFGWADRRAGEAAGQAAPGPEAAMPAMPRWDSGGLVGLGMTWVSTPDRYRYRDERAVYGLWVGRYWAEHLKTEVEGILPGETNTMYRDPETASSHPDAWVYTVWQVRPLKIGLVQVYQFGHNAWVHPFAGVGLDLDVERWSDLRPAQPVRVRLPDGSYRDDSVPEARRDGRALKARASLVGGAKVYVTRRAFARFDVRVDGAGGADHVALRGGFGVDF